MKLQIFDEAQFVTEFRFAERDIIRRLSEVLQLPHKIVCCQEIVANNIEALCILLLKTFLCLLFVSHGTTFGKKTYRNLWYLITNSTIFTANLISSLVLRTKMFYSWTNWQNCFGSVDGTVLRIFRPKINQNIVYNGHKRAHGITFQSLPLPNGLIGNLSGPFVGKWDDSTMSHASGLLSNLQRSVLT